MNKNEPNKVVNSLYKRLQGLRAAEQYDWQAHEVIKEELRKIHSVVGAVEVMSKRALMQLVLLNGQLRAIPFHQFHFPFDDALNIN